MGTLYYFHRVDDGLDELFALNKVYHYANLDALLSAFGDDAVRLAGEAGTPERFASRFIVPEAAPDWAGRIYARLASWSKGQRIRLMSEHQIDDVHAGLEYEEHIAKITGSAHDSDYEEDGVTYQPGSAW